ncbi:TPA: DUF4238 domain-containing protein [Morganella morganii]|nr:DUF4238 domain-containing protein [Morganella morganii]
MTHKGSNPKKHHFIPQGILKNFTKTGYLRWFSKELQKQHKQSTGSAGFKKYFYNYPESKESLETDFFPKIDSDAASIIDEIIKNKSIKSINANSYKKSKLIKYIATQKLRTPRVYDDMKRFEEIIKEEIHPDISMNNNENIRTTFLNGIKKNSKILEEILNEKKLELHKSKKGEEYIIGDDPVLSFNRCHQRNVIIASKDYPFLIKWNIYMFPISHNLMISFIDDDKSLIDDFLFYKENHNGFQFALSNDFVYSRTEETLEKEKQNYHNASYELIKNNSPEIIHDYNIKRGDKLIIRPFEITLTPEVRKQILEAYLKTKN